MSNAKLLIVPIALLAGSGALLAQTADAPAASYRDLRYPALNRIRVPEPVRYEMSNGMVVYLVEDHELPTIAASAMIRAGSRWEQAEKAGVASITGAVMRTGGSESRKGDQLDAELDRLGALVETFIGEDTGGASVSVLKEDIDTGLGILADLLQHPAFPQDKIDLAKISRRDAIARRNENAMMVASREFRKVIYGKDSPYARQTEYATIDSISRDDLIAFHRRFYQPENVILGLWGDFDTRDMRTRIDRAFGSWARGGQPKPEVPAVDPAASKRAGLYVVNKEDATQSEVVMGLLGGKYSDPDYFALNVANYILGGGFSSRLFSQVRSEQGLAYSVRSSWMPQWDHPGLFSAGGGTKSQTTLKIIRAIQAEIEKLGQGITEDELARAKDGILKGSAFDFDSTGKIVQRLMTYEYFGYPRDFLQRYQEGIRKVTREDVNRVSRQRLKTADMAVLVVGKEKDFEQPLATLGKVTAVEIK